MRELSLNEIGMVSGGVHDDKGGGGSGSSPSLGMAGSMGAGALGGAANYGASTLAGGKEFDMMDAAVAVSGGALSGTVAKSLEKTHGLALSVVSGNFVSGFISGVRERFKSRENKTGDDYQSH
ncbi:MAG: hypothetical protein Q4B81_05780 [Moraxella sp.]|nr:hypothetical protein [Moraxella sp.]